jgi:hypothetical protein
MPFSAKDRIEWINLQDKDRVTESQPWMQLAKTAQALGDDKGSRHVVYRLACRRLDKPHSLTGRVRERFSWLREQPFRIAWSIGTILLITTSLFWWAGSSGAIGPREKDSYVAWSKGQPFPVAFPKLNPFIYSLENELPLVKLGQDDKWYPDPSHQPISLGAGCLFHWTWIFDSYGFLTSVRWCLIVFGWVQATVLAAALSNRFKS